MTTALPPVVSGTESSALEAEDMPKYVHILRELRGRIVSGDYGRGQRLPSESALVKKFGVSRPTAARALRELATEGLVERRAGWGVL